MSDSFVVPLNTKSNSREVVGGKGRSLARMANAEDLPGLSFAGQQETYLNVRGAEEVAAAIKKCWASLWTPQAISYRHQNGIDQDSVAMAVVAQIMGGVEGGRGGCRSGPSVSRPFGCECLTVLSLAPFPAASHRTVLAVLPHTAPGLASRRGIRESTSSIPVLPDVEDCS